MDDLAHESRPFHSLTRKRKADVDDCSVQDSSVTVSADHSTSTEPILLDPSATPRCPTSTSDPSTSHAAWLLAHRDQQPWRPSSPAAHPSISCTTLMCKEGPSEPKRPRVETPSSFSPRRLRRSRSSYGYPYPVISPRRHYRAAAGRTGETRDTGIVSATEPGPSRGSLLRVSTVPAVPRPSRSLPVSPIEPLSPHIPSNQPPINRETLKELDLDAILRNPQLRTYHIYHSSNSSQFIFPPSPTFNQVTISFSTPVCNSVLHLLVVSVMPRIIIGKRSYVNSSAAALVRQLIVPAVSRHYIVFVNLSDCP